MFRFVTVLKFRSGWYV